MTRRDLGLWTPLAGACVLLVPITVNIWPVLLRSGVYMALVVGVAVLLALAGLRALWGAVLWLRARRDPAAPSRHRHHLWHAAVLGLAFAAALGINRLAADPLGLPPGADAQRFDPNGWHTNPWVPGHDSARQGMITDLARRILPALSRREAEILLGPAAAPAEVPASLAIDPTRTLAYPLGPERSAIALDTEWLLLDYDGQQYRGLRLRVD